jgi:hypothetical protein
LVLFEDIDSEDGVVSLDDPEGVVPMIDHDRYQWRLG